MIGTRPEAIKLAPVAFALAARGARPRLILTGQHADLDPGDFGLGEFTATRLGCGGLEDPHAHVDAVKRALLPHLAQPPDLLVVQGDTSSALGGARAAFAAGVPVAHVEAGLRSHDPRMPWPEEEYRIAIDARADLLFAPTELAAANLRRERVPGAVFVTGNSGIDALLAIAADLPPAGLRDGRLPRLLVTCHRRENWHNGLGSIALALSELAEEGAARIEVILHPNRHVSATIAKLLGSRHNIALLPPCSHRDLIVRMREADLMLSDSGGVQEEAPALGLPLLVLRDKTERPEGISSGNALLVGTDSKRILDAVRALLRDPVALAGMTRRSMPYGDGKAGPRIAAIIAQRVADRSRRVAG